MIIIAIIVHELGHYYRPIILDNTNTNIADLPVLPLLPQLLLLASVLLLVLLVAPLVALLVALPVALLVALLIIKRSIG